MITIGQPKPNSKVHFRGDKIAALCKPSIGNCYITDQLREVTCHKCIRAGNLPLMVRSDFKTKGAYIDYLHRFTPAGGISKVGISTRIRRGIEPLAAATDPPQLTPCMGHYYKRETYIKTTVKKVMKCRKNTQ